MSLKKITQLKQDKGFRPWDILIYGLVVAAIVVAFIVFSVTGKGENLKDMYALALQNGSTTQVGFFVQYDNVEIFRYDFVKDEYTVTNAQAFLLKSDDEKSLVFQIWDGDGYNTVVVDKVAITVDVTEANCSSRRDCVFMEKISTTKNTIICTPHKLIIKPFGYRLEDKPDILM